MPRKPVHPLLRQRVARACESCQRRKQKCNGALPCSTCVKRGVAGECHFSKPLTRSPETESASEWVNLPDVVDQSHAHTLKNKETDPSSLSARLIQDSRGQHLFLGDSSNFYFLQALRRIVKREIGSCEFVDDLLRFSIVEPSLDEDEAWSIGGILDGEMPTVSLTDVEVMADRYLACTRGYLEVLEEADVRYLVSSFPTDGNNVVALLVLAIGAMNSPDLVQGIASCLYTRARHLSARGLEQEPSLESICANLLATFYLLCKSRRNASYMTLGTAIRGCYSLGLHRHIVSASFSNDECQKRERLWRAARTLDLHLSSSLGRPPSTSFADPRNQIEHSIVETILVRFYSRQKMDTTILDHVGSQFKTWAAQLANKRNFLMEEPASLQAFDAIQEHLAYYHAIVLMVRPFLLRTVIAQVNSENRTGSCTENETARSRGFLHGSISAAIYIVSLSSTLVRTEKLSRHLPFNIYYVFLAALTLGCAVFGGLSSQFLLQDNLHVALRLLDLFPDDHIARRNASIVRSLVDACQTFLEKQKMTTNEQGDGPTDVSLENEGARPNIDEDMLDRPSVISDMSGGAYGTESWEDMDFEDSLFGPDETWWTDIDDIWASTYCPPLNP